MVSFGSVVLYYKIGWPRPNDRKSSYYPLGSGHLEMVIKYMNYLFVGVLGDLGWLFSAKAYYIVQKKRKN